MLYETYLENNQKKKKNRLIGLYLLIVIYLTITILMLFFVKRESKILFTYLFGFITFISMLYSFSNVYLVVKNINKIDKNIKTLKKLSIKDNVLKFSEYSGKNTEDDGTVSFRYNFYDSNDNLVCLYSYLEITFILDMNYIVKTSGDFIMEVGSL